MLRPEFRLSGKTQAFLAGLLSAILAAPVTAQSGSPGGGVSNAAPAVGLTVTPLRVELSTIERTETISVVNGFDKPLAIQARIFSWTQVNGEDVYAPSTDHIASPSIVMIPAGEAQMVRVLRRAAAAPGEKAYRLVLDQIPDNAVSDMTGTTPRIRFILPMFVDRDKAEPAKLAWRLDKTGLELRNEGGATARVLNVAVKRANGEAVTLNSTDLRYVLGASAIRYPFANSCGLGKVTVTATVDGEPVNVEPVPACG